MTGMGHWRGGRTLLLEMDASLLWENVKAERRNGRSMPRDRSSHGFHRHPHPLRLHPPSEPAGREQDPPGCHHGGGGQLRLLHCPCAARQGRCPSGLPEGRGSLAELRAAHLCPVPGRIPFHLGEHGDAGGPRDPAPDGHGPGGARPHCQRDVTYAATPGRGPRGGRPGHVHRAVHCAGKLRPERGVAGLGRCPAPARGHLCLAHPR